MFCIPLPPPVASLTFFTSLACSVAGLLDHFSSPVSSDGIATSAVVPLAKSKRKSAGLVANSGVNPMLSKYPIASEAFPKNTALPSASRSNLSNEWKRREEGW